MRGNLQQLGGAVHCICCWTCLREYERSKRLAVLVDLILVCSEKSSFQKSASPWMFGAVINIQVLDINVHD